MFRSVEDKESNGDRKSHVIIKNKQRHKYVRGQRQAFHCASDLWWKLILNKLRLLAGLPCSQTNSQSDQSDSSPELLASSRSNLIFHGGVKVTVYCLRKPWLSHWKQILLNVMELQGSQLRDNGLGVKSTQQNVGTFKTNKAGAFPLFIPGCGLLSDTGEKERWVAQEMTEWSSGLVIHV